MIKTNILTALYSALFVLSVSCSHRNQKHAFGAKEKSPNKSMTKEKKLSVGNSVQEIEEKLKLMTDYAIKEGDDSIRYLSADMYLKASSSMLRGDFETARMLFVELMRLAPHDKFVKRKYAISLIRGGKLKLAKSLLQSLLRDDYDEDIALVLAGVLSSLGDIKSSQDLYKTVLRKNDKNSDACVFLSKSYSMQKRPKEAVDLLKKCSAKNKNDATYPYYIGKILVNEQKYKLAQGAFERSLKIDPEFSQSRLALALVAQELNQKRKAQTLYKQYLDNHPNNTLVLGRIVQLLFEAEKFKEVIPYAKRLIELDKEDLNLQVKLGILYADIKQFDKAIESFRNLLKLVPNNDKVLYYLGAIYQEIKEFEQSISYFSLITPKSGLYQDSILQVANMLNSLAESEYYNVKKEDARNSSKNYEQQFIAHVDKAIKDFPELKVELVTLKAVYYENIQNNKVAIKLLEGVSSLEGFKENNLYHLASLYEKVGQFLNSERIIEKVILKRPEDAHALNFLGYSLLERGVEFERAYRLIKKAVKLRPDDGYIRDSLGWYYYKTGQVDMALKELKLAVKTVGDDVSIQKHLAVVYGHLNDFEKAKEHVLKAINLAKLESEKKKLFKFLSSIESKRLPASFYPNMNQHSSHTKEINVKNSLGD